MVTKTLGTIVIILICVLLFPVGIGIVAGVFGIVAGAFGAIFGIIGAIFGGIFSLFAWMFDGFFNWHWPHAFFNCNIFTLVAIILIIALVARSKKGRIS